MKRSPLNVLFYSLMAVLGVLFIAGVFASRKMIPLLLSLLAVAFLTDLRLGMTREKRIAWLALAIGFGWKTAMAMTASSVQIFQAFVPLRRVSWLFLTFIVYGFGLRIYALIFERKSMKVGDENHSWSAPFIEFFGNWGIELLLLAITALSLRMLVPSGYYWDDALNSTQYLFERQDGIPLIQNLLSFMGKYLALGRINVLSAYYYFLFYIPSVAAYKALIIALVLACQLVVRVVLTYMTGSLSLGQFTMLLIPLLIQLRAYQDPVSGFYGLMQVLLITILLMAYFFTRYLRGGQKRNLIFSLAAYMVGCMIYEVVFPFGLLIPLLCWAEGISLKQTIKEILPFLLICLVLLGVVLILRLNLPTAEVYEGVRFKWKLSAILRTYGIQLLAALPLSYYTFTDQLTAMEQITLADGFFRQSSDEILRGNDTADYLLVWLLVFSAVLIFQRWYTESGNGNGNRALRPALALGLCLFLLPAVTIALSTRYQGQLVPGLGYLPVYISLFGVAIVLALLVNFLLRRRNAFLQGFLLALIAVVFLVTTQHNRLVTHWMDRVFYYPRQTGEQALESGLFDFLPDNATVISMNPGWYMWEASWGPPRRLYGEFNTIHSGRDFVSGELQAGGRDDLAASLNDQPDRPLYLFSYQGSETGGVAVLGKVTATADETNLITEEVIYFLHGEGFKDQPVIYITDEGEPGIVDARTAYPIRVSENGTLYQLNPQEAIRFDSFGMVDFALLRSTSAELILNGDR
jgi:hypothetical protein